jgi:hypothetical protein
LEAAGEIVVALVGNYHQFVEVLVKDAFAVLVDWQAQPATDFLALSGGRAGFIQGANLKDVWVTPYVILGLLPAPKRGVSNIRSPYVKRFGVPSPGQRVFIRTRQLINGWEDEPKEINALVPTL